MTAPPSTSPIPPPFVICASGHAEIPHPAERAVVHVAVTSSGANKVAVSDEVITTAKHIEALLRPLSAEGSTPETESKHAVAHWSKTSLSATSYLPVDYSNPDKIQTRQYDAKIDFDIRFQDFKVLGAFGSKLTALPHVEVNSIDWVLTEATKRSFTSQLRKEAAKDALMKARDYCEVLGYSNPRPVELTESGVPTTLPRGQFGGQQLMATRAFGVAEAAGGGAREEERDESDLEFKPEEVRMSTDITVTFHAQQAASS